MYKRIVFIFLILGGIIFGNHLTTKAFEPQKEVHGIVTDSAGTPLKGVEILIKGRTTGTYTDPKGSYSIYVTNSDTLVFSQKGMISQEIFVSQKTKINVVLQKSKNNS